MRLTLPTDQPLGASTPNVIEEPISVLICVAVTVKDTCCGVPGVKAMVGFVGTTVRNGV
ncbi:hypothetical protein [Azospirillum brasilense]|uniref:hypothetical protein n=1 Tax=Azospirillum brasilense TaxID=192 RepID=UPI001659420E|nr:hypothetical protein [Azospirillum brasilense]